MFCCSRLPLDVLQARGHDAGGRRLPAVLLLLGQMENIKELAIRSNGSRILRASALRQIVQGESPGRTTWLADGRNSLPY